MTATIEFESLMFEDKDNQLIVTLLNLFYFEIPRKELEKIGKYNIKLNKNNEARIIEFQAQQNKADNKFSFLITKHITELKNKLNQNKTIYIHQNSGIPLIGNLGFGIVDKGTNILELKPITGCNINCIFCSVDEGLSSKKHNDFVIEKDYLIQETIKVIEYKKQNSKEDIEMDIYINPHGEPLLYADLPQLIEDLRKIKEIKNIILITNGLLLTKNLVDKLEHAGLSELNISLNSLDPEKAKKIAGTEAYNIKKIKEILTYAADKITTNITPVFMKGINEEDIEEIIQFAKEIKINRVGIQNYLQNIKGRKPTKEIVWEDFYKIIKQLEDKFKIKLDYREEFKLEATPELPKPFKKGEVINAEIVCQGRFKNDKIAVANERNILIRNCSKTGRIKLKINRSNHNIYVGELVK